MKQISYQTITTIKSTEKSRVYLASMEGRDEPVIIKRMTTANPEVYKTLAEIHSDHIPQIYAVELQENELVVAEEYVDGETLEYYLREGLLTEDGVLKPIDYDASRQYKKKSEGSDTRILGTANYAAPEQFGYQQTDVRSDIYSMGVVFEMLHFHGVALAMFAWKKMLGICTNFDPKKRYKSINGLGKAIRRVMLLQKIETDISESES